METNEIKDLFEIPIMKRDMILNNLPNLIVTELFAGAGMQRRGIENAKLWNYVQGQTCEMDIYAILEYAAIHNGLTFEMVDEYKDFPDRQVMINDLKRMRIGYDFVKNKEYNWDKKLKSKSKDIELVWLACKLNNNVGDIMKVENLKPCNMLTWSFPCFVEGTMVLTKNGYKEIQNVIVGDEVLTHTNTWQKVSKTMVNEANSLISINCMPSENIYCTPNHPFYVRKLNRVHNSQTGCSERIFDNPEWIAAKDLSKEYYVGTAINPIEEIPVWNGINKNTIWGHKINSNTISLKFNTPEFWYIIGRYIGDGWIRNQSGIIICANKEEVGQIYPYLDKLGWGYTQSEERTVVKIHIPFQEIGVYCEQFGKGAANKHLTSDILNLPINLLKEFLNGYMDADGSYTQGKYKASSVSRRLIYELAQCINKAYHVHCHIYFIKRKHTTVIEGRTVNQRDQYQLVYSLEKSKYKHAFYENGYIWCPINSITEEDYDGLVYNLEIENDNSYQVQNVIVHNCTDLSVAGKQAGMVKTEDGQNGTRSGLVYEVIRLLKNMAKDNILPEFMIMENVDALINKKNKPAYDLINEEISNIGIGYNAYYELMNTKFYSYPEHPVPQNRNRCYCMYIRKDIDNKNFIFPKKFDSGIRLVDILEDDVDEKFYINNEKERALIKELILNGTLTEEDLDD